MTGATGVLGGAATRALAGAGARVVVLGRRSHRAEEVAAQVVEEGGEALAAPADVLALTQLEAVRERALARWGRVDILVNAAGGNVPAATVPEGGSVFDLTVTAWRDVLDANLTGTLLPCQVFGAAMAERGSGAIVNFSSMAARRALTRVPGYSAAKAGVDNLTRWLAVELARLYGSGVRVNAIAPGFFAGEQNRALLFAEDGSLTPRGQAISERTPAGRFGAPEDLIGTLIWLCSPAAAFVNGVVVAVDGGFDAFSGV